jgi:hypothetical protein
LAEVAVVTMPIGYPKDPGFQWVDPALQKMKRGEIAVVVIERLKLDQNEMKVLEGNRFLLVQLIDWVTIIGKKK